MKRVRISIINFLKTSITIFLSLGAITLICLFLFTQVKEWIYLPYFPGNDTPQFIHFVYYYLKHPGFPLTSWDYFWHNGVPRVIDLAWMHFTIASILAKIIGIYQTLKLYPVATLALGAVFTFLFFYELSKSILTSLVLTISFVLSRGYYEALFSAGVVLSAMSQMFLPAQLYFLARFIRRRTYRNLVLAAIFSALGMYGHGLLMMFFGFIPSLVFLFFSSPGERFWPLITKRSVLDTFLFAFIVLTVGALGIWPSLALAKAGGSTTTFYGGTYFDPKNLENMFSFTNPGIGFGFFISFLFGAIFILLRRRLDVSFRPVFFLFCWYGVWMLSYTFFGNPLFGVLFPGRIFWIWPLVLGALTSVLVYSFSHGENGLWFVGLRRFFYAGFLKLLVAGAVILGIMVPFAFRPWAILEAMRPPQEWKIIDIAREYSTMHANLLSMVDNNNSNVRLWSHDQVLNLTWVPVSDIPLSEGYAHIWTKYSRLWEGWFYGVMSFFNWESQEIPRDMAEKQALFFLDWYGVRYISANKDSGEWDVAGYFYNDPSYIEDHKIFDSGQAVFVVSSEYSFPLISSVNVPVVGFVGNDDAYMVFLKDLAMLNLNTSYLIPVKLSTSISGIPSDRLSLVDALVIYDFGKGGLFYSYGFDKILDFVKNGGKVWVETGGNSTERESPNLPAIFPIVSNQYGSLGKDWQPGGELASKIDFSLLEPLVYRKDPWNISYTELKNVKPGAKVLLTQKDYPVAVKYEIGKGEVLWTGVNFWYRPEEYRKNGLNEVVFIKLFLEELFGELPQKRILSSVERERPEKIEVKGRGFSGVVFKENHWPGWVAKVSSSGKEKRVPIFTAGPELMYISIPKDMREGEIRVFLNYQGNPSYWFAFFVSCFSILLTAGYLIFRNRFLRFFSIFNFKVFGKIKKRAYSWWGGEEE